MTRGGPQVIPRPDDWRPGAVAPWAHIPESERVVTIADLRRAFTGRVGAPSVAEAGAAAGSAVLAPFYEEAGELWVVLTRRSWTLRAHTGEVAFPGGRIEPGESPTQAALREAKEEVALDPATVEVLGELDHLMTVTSSSFIVPFVGVLGSGRPQLVPSPGEVDAVLHVEVAELLRDNVFTEELWRFTAADFERTIFFFALEADTLWGATAAMLRHLLALALDVPTGIDHA